MQVFLFRLRIMVGVFLATFSLSYGQSTQIYGLQNSNPGNPQNSPLSLVAMNPATGQVSPMFTISNSNAVALGSSTYDHGQKRFIYWGLDTGNQSLYYSVGTQDSTTISTPFSGTGFPIELQYDLQHDTLYGLSFDQSTSTQYLASIDLNSGTMQNVSSIPGVQLVVVGNSSFNSNTGRYTFHGGVSGDFRQYVLDAHTGQVVHSPSLSNSGYLRGLSYDLNTNQLFSLLAVYDSSMIDPQYNLPYQRVYLAEIDTLTAAVTIVDSTAVLEGYQTGIIAGSIDFDQANRRMVFLGQDETTDFRLIMVDAATGLVNTDVPISSYVLEMEVDNQSFAREAYQGPASFINSQLSVLPLQVFPNPANELLQVEIGTASSSLQEVQLLDVQGRILRNIQLDRPRHSLEISLNNLASGFYLVRARDQEGHSYQSRFVKE
ncbi:MAG: T9SS type A sorting domain-containing protein [Bacteroidota bacterium]